MKAVFSWLGRTALLYVLLVAAIALALVIAPSTDGLIEGWRDDAASTEEIAADLSQLRAQGQAQLERATDTARTLPLEALEQRIVERTVERERLGREVEAAGDGFLAAYRPSRIVERKRAEIALAVTVRELAVLEAAQAPRESLSQASEYLANNPKVPTSGAIDAARRQCARDRRALAAFEARREIERRLRELVRSERSQLEQASRRSCARVRTLAERRERGLAAVRTARTARDNLEALSAAALPDDLERVTARPVLRDILWQALLALLAILLLPLALRAFAWVALAPIAERRRSLRFAPPGSAPALTPPDAPSSVSLEIVLGTGEEVLVRQDHLQSAPLGGTKRTRWLLDWSRPMTSLASGMRFLTAIGGTGERVSLSATKQPLAELAMLDLPAGAAIVVRPSALAAIVQPEGSPVPIESAWRLFALPAWLTGRLRFLVFHGPARLVLKGGRGVRIEAAGTAAESSASPTS